ncbi:hypothetical protein [Hymenobacter actinosclerus]|uniref:Uncharacterized protein n=1 Tax=Hymenobacter actinosclerus TaxID=82805 RepID=A0A1H9Z1W9_9BACT|nr:hypothetical protein [Hymenobacter actinosclerus]SES75348.1 hypothetical protein SAMN04487998_0172 [Hymenobacter actinosclerus]
MRIPLLPAAGLTAAALLITTAPVAAQQVPTTPAPAPAEAPMDPAAAKA